MIRYFEIGWLSKTDGPGNRVVIYLQGCNLRCPWCHSPHSWSLYAPILFNSSMCTNCGMCVSVCRQGVHKIENGIHILNRSSCTKCGACQTACPNSQPDYLGSALCLPTKEKEPEELFSFVQPQLEMLKANGGVTLSGGEALLQAEDVCRFLLLCKEHGISTCVESSFSLPEENYRKAAPYTDYWLAGLRDTGYGKGNRQNDEDMLKKLLYVSSWAKKITARYPLIGGYTTKPEHLERYGEIMKKTRITDVNLLKCNSDMMHYYRLSGMICKLNLNEIETTDQQCEEAIRYFKKEGFQVSID